MLPTIATGNVASAIGGGYEVANSCKFETNTYMNLSIASAGNARTWTYSFWTKRTKLGAWMNIHNFGGTGNRDYSAFDANDHFEIAHYDSGYGYRFITNAVYRDPSAWMHICVAMDTTQSTEANRTKIYINGTQVTSFSTATYPDEDHDTRGGQNIHMVGSDHDPSNYYFGYLAEFVYVNGSQLAPTSFGEFDEDSPTIFKPINVSGLTFGTSGFYLDFESSGTLGNDASGGSDFTSNNLAATDQATDTPTNNFATFNPLFPNTFTFSEGNCVVNADAGSAHQLILSTIAPANGVWYAEFKITDLGGDYAQIGIRDVDQFVTAQYVGQGTRGYGYSQHGVIAASGSNAATGQTAISADDIIGVWMDLDNQVLKWYKNDSLLYTYSSVTAAYSYAFAVSIYGSTSGQWEGNFGGCSGFTVSSGNADPNGYGNFEYATKSGYALCTKNLAEFGG